MIPARPHRPVLSILVMVALFCLPAPVRGAGDPPDPVLVRLQAKIESLRSLRGRFVQRLDSRSLGRALAESGRFAIRKPGAMRWEYEEPERKIAVTDGTTTWLHLVEENEVQIGTYPEGGEGSAASLLSGRMRLDRDFTSRRLTPEEAAGAGPTGVAGGLTLLLEPRAPTEEFESLMLTLDPVRLEIRAIVLVDSLGGRMTFEFFDLEENPPIDDAFFRFEIPAGAEVVDMR